MSHYIIDVMLKSDILDPQGRAISQAVLHQGIQGITRIRQGKRFEIDCDDTVTEDQITHIAASILTNEVIEDFHIEKIG